MTSKALIELDKLAIEQGYTYQDKYFKDYEKFCNWVLGVKLLGWQAETAKRLLCWRNSEGEYRYRVCSIWIPKKNGKSFFCSSLALYFLCKERTDSNVALVARDSKQCQIIYNDCLRFTNKKLSGFLTKRTNSKELLFPGKNNHLYAVSKDSGTAQGLRNTVLIWDELHVSDIRLYSALEHSQLSQTNPIWITISTAGEDKNHFSYQFYKKAKNIIEGKDQDIHFLPVVYEGNDNQDKKKVITLDNLKLANPAIGESLKESEFTDKIKKAKKSESEYYTFKRYLLNIWGTGTVDSWLNPEHIEACNGKNFDISRYNRCYGGLDYAVNGDLAAFVLLFTNDSNEFYIKPYIFSSREQIEQLQAKTNTPYKRWENDGYINVNEGNVIDADCFKQEVMKLIDRYNPTIIGLDKWNTTIDQSISKNYPDVECFEIRQGFKTLSEPTKKLEVLVKGGNLHFDNPVLANQLNNCSLDIDSNQNIKPSKKDRHKKIDAVAALINALCCYLHFDYTNTYKQVKEIDISFIYS